MDTFVEDPDTADDPRTEIYHRDGIPWHEAPQPRLLHRHRIQTYGFLDYFTRFDRCSCGAIRQNKGRWQRR